MNLTSFSFFYTQNLAGLPQCKGMFIYKDFEVVPIVKVESIVTSTTPVSQTFL